MSDPYDWEGFEDSLQMYYQNRSLIIVNKVDINNPFGSFFIKNLNSRYLKLIIGDYK